VEIPPENFVVSQSSFAIGDWLCSIVPRLPSSDDVPAPKPIMQTQTNGNAVLDKTRELCQTILTDPNMGEIRKRIDTFMADPTSRSHYDSVVSKGQVLHEKQEQSQPLSQDEVSAFEADRENLLKNPVARGFLDAREELHELQHSIQKLVSKTLELGRMPTNEDLEEGCGHGSCGCHGH
jgi:cell fate (sporulation/competence/biofilm development) regulator YlbF (YheA/YmcA/DUF963 family)